MLGQPTSIGTLDTCVSEEISQAGDLLHTTSTCALKPAHLMDHNWLHSQT